MMLGILIFFRFGNSGHVYYGSIMCLCGLFLWLRSATAQKKITNDVVPWLMFRVTYSFFFGKRIINYSISPCRATWPRKQKRRESVKLHKVLMKIWEVLFLLWGRIPINLKIYVSSQFKVSQFKVQIKSINTQSITFFNTIQAVVSLI